MGDAERVEAFDVVEIVNGVGDDGEFGGFPVVDDGLVDPAADDSDDFDTGFFGEGEDVLWGPSIPDSIKGVEDGFPRVDFHDPVEHLGVVNLDDEAVEDRFVDRFSEFDETIKLGLYSRFIGVFTVGDDVDIGMGLHEAQEIFEVERVIFIVPERRHEIIVGKGSRVESRSAGVIAELNSSIVSPVVGVMREDNFAVVGDVEIGFEDALTEVVVQEKSFVRIGISVAVNSAHSMGDIGVVEPRIVKIVRFCVAGDNRGGCRVVGNFDDWSAEVLGNDSEESGTEGDAENNDNGY